MNVAGAGTPPVYPVIERRSILPDLLPPAIVAFCIVFNFFLCFINTKITDVSPAQIILCEIILTGAAVASGFFRIDRIKFYWLVILGLQIGLILILSAFKGEFLIKPLRDIMIMPIFVILGLAAYRIDFSKILMGISVFVLLVALWEAFATPSFLSLFNIRDFYIAKGILKEETFITGLDVFASGERPGGRFLFDIPGVHRVSSVFLEPVSLGFYAVISGIYFIAAKDGLSKKMYISGILLSFILIWLSDARLAMGTLVLALLLRPVFSRLDHRFALLFFPGIVFLSYLLYTFGILSTTGEGLGARLGWTINLLANTSLEILVGVSSYDRRMIADSGLGYILNDQGLIGLLLFWLPPFFFFKKLPEPARVYLFGISIFLALGMMLTQAFITLKTAGLLWFCFGYLVSRNLRDQNGNYHYAS